jgi:hypothetical protein
MRQYIFKNAQGDECLNFYIWMFTNIRNGTIKIKQWPLTGGTPEDEKLALFNQYKEEVIPYSYKVYEDSVLTEEGLVENLSTTP